MSAASIIA